MMSFGQSVRRLTPISFRTHRMSPRFLIFETDISAYHCGLIQQGIRLYFREEKLSMKFLPLGVSDLDSLEGMNMKDSFAIICWLNRPSSVDYIQQLEIPYLNLRESDNCSNVGLQVAFRGEGTLAARYFIDEMNYESLAFVGMGHVLSNRRRFDEFRKHAESHNLKVDAHFLRSKFKSGQHQSIYAFDSDSVIERNNELNDLLHRIPRPAGIFCADDHIALSLYFRALHHRMQVPDEVSILGVGSLQGAEDGGVQSISVVQMDHIRQGYQAAQLMDQYLSGQAPEKHITLSPERILHRSTTSRYSVKDPLVQRAYLAMEKDGSLTVNQLSQHLKVSRRTLENRFLAATNLTVARAMDHQRFHRAKHLLKTSHYKHEAIASLAGYRSYKQMIRSFHRYVQMSPRQYYRSYLVSRRES